MRDGRNDPKDVFHTYLVQLLAGGARLDDIVPGVTLHGEDVGRRLATRQRDWSRLNEEQQRRLCELGVEKAPRTRKAPAKPAASGPCAGGEAFQKGREALQQYIAREGTLQGPAGVQEMSDGDMRRVGVWPANQKQRRDRPDQAQLAALAGLGVRCAAV
ncbi:hypothetical protein WKI68_37250 [Streptomyces sp. MS1.HAVA.3]|uniref:Helicase-associated domain-containing protein n=1 Tax=Streptomyces caledonius TaxID=3134107 RepID=A0ABU8UBV4_9ACTN